MEPSFRMLAVHCADQIAFSVLEVMITYLTDVWNLSLTHAAAVINIFEGARDMLVVGMVFLVDSFLGHHHMFLISAILNCIGMSLLSLSAPPILSKEVSNIQKGLYWTALPLLAIGYAGHKASYERSLESQLHTLWENIIKKRKITAGSICYAAIFLLSYVGVFVIQFVESWALRFGISTICLIIATFLYLTGIGSYRKGTPRGSPLTTFFRVLVASYSKKSCALPIDANKLYQENIVPTMPHTNNLRCLDRAAIIVSNSSLEEQKCNRWKLCTVTEVEEAKVFLHMIPLWMTFAMCGVVTSIGSTYFMEQGNQMDPYLGKLKVPLFTLLVFQTLAETLFSFMCGKVRVRVPANLRKYVPPIGMVVAIICSILCCITAAAIERRRLDVVRSHELMEKPKDKNMIPMTIFWLIPQYLFLSALNGISSYCFTRFFKDQSPESLRNYLDDIKLGVTGAGFMGSVVSVYAFGKVSEIGGNPSWFQDTLNKSRLDNYYWSLAVLSSIHLVLYPLVALQFPYRDSESQTLNLDSQSPEEDSKPPEEDSETPEAESEPPEERTVTHDRR